jgi:hypothetical protein
MSPCQITFPSFTNKFATFLYLALSLQGFTCFYYICDLQCSGWVLLMAVPIGEVREGTEVSDFISLFSFL